MRVMLIPDALFYHQLFVRSNLKIRPILCAELEDLLHRMVLTHKAENK